MDLRQGLPGLAPLTPGDLGIQPPALAVPVFDVTPPPPPPPPASGSGYRFPRSTIFNDPVLDGTLDRVADAGPNLTAGDGLFYGYYWDGQYQDAHQRWQQGAYYARIATGFLIGWYTLGPILGGGLLGTAAELAIGAGGIGVGYDAAVWYAGGLSSGRWTNYGWDRAALAWGQGVWAGAGALGAARVLPFGRQLVGGVFAAQGLSAGADALSRGEPYEAVVHFVGAGLAGAGALPGGRRLGSSIDVLESRARGRGVGELGEPLGRAGPLDSELVPPRNSVAPEIGWNQRVRLPSETPPSPAAGEAAGGAALPQPGRLQGTAGAPTADLPRTATDVFRIDVSAERPTAGAHEPVQVGGPGTPPMQPGQTNAPGGRGPGGGRGGTSGTGMAGLPVENLLPQTGRRQGTAPNQRVPLEVLGNDGCFGPETPMNTPDGMRRIKDIGIGSRVWSRNEFAPDAPIVAKVVEKIFVHFAPILELYVQGRLIRTTAGHRFNRYNDGWTPANELGRGDLLRTDAGGWVKVEAVVDTGECAIVYNLQIEEFHTYFVGGQEWGFAIWAHNAGCPLTADQLAPIAAEYARIRRAGNRPYYDDLFGPDHANLPPAQRRANERALRRYIREHRDELGVDVPPSRGGRMGNSEPTQRTLRSIDDYFRARGLVPEIEVELHHQAGRLSEASHRTADRVIVDLESREVYVIQSADTLPGGGLHPREVAPIADILASREIAVWRNQGFDVRVQLILRGQEYSPLSIINERGMRRMLTPDLYPRGSRPSVWRGW
jgi:hypothetical protein